MSIEAIASEGPMALPTPQTSYHPLAPLDAAEITTAAELVKALWPSATDLQFKAITLEEPPKTEVIPFLHAERHGLPLPYIGRKAFANYYIRNTVSAASFLAIKSPHSTWRYTLAVR